MNGFDVVGSGERNRVLNAVPLENAVLCAECEVVSDSPHDVYLVCGSHSLFNVARIFGGTLPKKRASSLASNRSKPSPAKSWSFLDLIDREGRKWVSSTSVIALEEHGPRTDPVMLVGPQAD
jgi:hypothetical protein